MGKLTTALLFMKEAVQIRARFPSRPRVRVLAVRQTTSSLPLASYDGPHVPVPETTIVYEYKVPDPYEGQAPWEESSLVIREWEGEHMLMANFNHMGLEFEPPHQGSGALGLWGMTLPLSLLGPVWLLWNLRHAANERRTGMSRYSRAAYKALAPQLDAETRALLERVLKRHWQDYLQR